MQMPGSGWAAYGKFENQVFVIECRVAGKAAHSKIKKFRKKKKPGVFLFECRVAGGAAHGNSKICFLLLDAG